MPFRLNKKNWNFKWFQFFVAVASVGLEPTWFHPVDLESTASTNFAKRPYPYTSKR